MGAPLQAAPFGARTLRAICIRHPAGAGAPLQTAPFGARTLRAICTRNRDHTLQAGAVPFVTPGKQACTHLLGMGQRQLRPWCGMAGATEAGAEWL